MIRFWHEAEVSRTSRKTEKADVHVAAPKLLVYIPTDDILRFSFRLEGRGAQTCRNWDADGVFDFSGGPEDPAGLITNLAQTIG